jgi:hypothetical protein
MAPKNNKILCLFNLFKHLNSGEQNRSSILGLAKERVKKNLPSQNI